jgi:Protein of unknown function (DUF4239)
MILVIAGPISPLASSLIAFACVFGGALIGLSLGRVLPEPHLSADSKSTVNLGMGLVGTMGALVLGLVVSAAASSFFSVRDDLIQMSSKIVVLDRILAYYGPEARPARDVLRTEVAALLDQMWPQEHSRASQLLPVVGRSERLYDQIQQLSPHNESQTFLKNSALSLAMEIGKTRWLMVEQQSFSVPAGLLAVVVLWLAIVFWSYGLYAPRNATVMVAFFLGAVSVAGAILLISELYSPFGGLIRISNAPLRNALEQLGK